MGTFLSPDLSAQERILLESFYGGLRPPPDFTVSQWADEHRRLPRVSSSEAGPWRTSRTPYLREIQDEMSPSSHTEEVVVMKGSQLGFTECIVNISLYYMAHAPCPILAIQPTIGVAKKFSKQRMQPSINECLQLKGKVTSSDVRKGGNTTLQKDFPGGTMIIGGANSAADLRSMPIQVLLADEIDGYPSDVDGEGDPLELARRRSTNFYGRKVFMGSTPAVAEISRIQKAFDDSDQRYFFVPCPKCNEKQIIKWENIKWEDRKPETVRLICEHCGEAIEEHHKTWMLENGEWRKQKPEATVAGFHISALYSPLGWYSWKEAVKDHLKALGDPQKRKVWVNTVLGEVWEDSAATIDAHWLAKRKETYSAECPDGVLCLTAGCDTQDNRVETSVWGWGWNSGLIESWLIDHAVFMGDPGQKSFWTLIDDYLMREFQHENGIRLHIASTCFDAMGHFTSEVYKFCAAREFRRIFPVQGKAGPGRPIISKAYKSKRQRVYLFQVGVDQAKETIYSRLKIPDPGPGYVHFPKALPTLTEGQERFMPETYFTQLTAEKRILRHSAGMPRLQWVLPSGKRNETLDCFVYALAAMNILSPNLELMAREKRVFKSDFSAAISRPTRRVISSGVKP